MDRRWHILLFLSAAVVPIALGVFAFFALRNGASFPAIIAPLSAAHPASLPSGARIAPHSRARVAGFSNWDENRLADLARTGEACAMLESPLTARAPLPALYRLFPGGDSAGLPSRVLEAYLEALSARTDHDFEAALRTASHPLLDLTEAAGLLGLLPGHPAGDPSAAIPILRALADSDSLNAVPSLLLAYALRKAGETEESGAELEQALARPGFNTYSSEALRSLTQRARGKPALLSAAMAIGARAPGPDLFPVEDFLLDALSDSDPHVADLAYAFGRRLNAQEDDLNGALNFGFGQRVAATAWKKLHPAQKAPKSLTERPVPAGTRGLLAGLTLPLAKGSCEKALPRLAERLENGRVIQNRAPAL